MSRHPDSIKPLSIFSQLADKAELVFSIMSHSANSEDSVSKGPSPELTAQTWSASIGELTTKAWSGDC
jgi:hypothetical protein